MRYDRTILAGWLCVLAAFSLCAPVSAVTGNRDLAGMPGAAGMLNVTNGSLVNATFPAEYQVTPTPISLGYSTNGPLSGAPKGEMGAVPRSIGISVSPAAVVIGVIIIAVAGIGYLVYRNRNVREGENGH